MQSDSGDLSKGASLRADLPLLISDDCLQLNISMSKNAETKSMNFTLKQTNVNLFAGDLARRLGHGVDPVNNRTDYESLLSRIPDIATGKTKDTNGKTVSANNFNDGLKFVGRIDDVYKDITIDPQSGTKMSSFAVKCTGFQEMETYMYYDYALATSDAQGGNFGWMARFGVSTDALFGKQSEDGIEPNNINNIIPILLDLVLGKGPPVQGWHQHHWRRWNHLRHAPSRQRSGRRHLALQQERPALLLPRAHRHRESARQDLHQQRDLVVRRHP